MFARPVLIFPHFYANNSDEEEENKKTFKKKEYKTDQKRISFSFRCCCLASPGNQPNWEKMKKKERKEMFFHDQVGWHPQLPLFYNISRLPAMEKFRFACF
jgi:hypothetical protein